MRYSFLLLTFVLALSQVNAKKHVLTYHFTENKTIEYVRTDSVTSVMLIGGLGEKLATYLQFAYSISFVSNTEQGDAHLLLQFNKIVVSRSFNGQETLQMSTTQKTTNEQNKVLFAAFSKLKATPFPFSITANGQLSSLPNIDDFTDSLQFSKAEKRSLAIFFNQDYLKQIIQQSFPILPEGKVKDQAQWQDTSAGTLKLPYHLQLNHHLLITDKTTFSIETKGSTDSEQQGLITLGKANIKIAISNAVESHQRICSLDEGHTEKFNYVATVNAYPIDSNKTTTRLNPPISYRVKTILIKK